jgi:hypothetical protein
MTTENSDLPSRAVAIGWRKSSFSGGGECVILADHADRIAVRDSKDPDGGTLFLTRGEMAAWLAGIKAGEFDDLVGLDDSI